MMIIIPKQIPASIARFETSISTAYTVLCNGQSYGKYIDYNMAIERAKELSELTGKTYTVKG